MSNKRIGNEKLLIVTLIVTIGLSLICSYQIKKINFLKNTINQKSQDIVVLQNTITQKNGLIKSQQDNINTLFLKNVELSKDADLVASQDKIIAKQKEAIAKLESDNNKIKNTVLQSKVRESKAETDIEAKLAKCMQDNQSKESDLQAMNTRLQHFESLE